MSAKEAAAAAPASSVGSHVGCAAEALSRGLEPEEMTSFSPVILFSVVMLPSWESGSCQHFSRQL